MTGSFQKQCAEYVSEFARRRLLDSSGRRLSAETRKILSRQPGHMGRGVGLAAAVLSRPGWWDGPAASARILEDYARRLISIQAREFTARCSGRGFPPNFDLLPLIPAIEMLLPTASAAERRVWLRMAEACAGALSRFLLKKEAAWGKPGPFTGCGPNHLYIMAAPLHRIGKLLGDADSCRLARRAVHALCRQQSEEGYFPENVGPVVGYHRVYMIGLTDYRRTSGDRFVDPALARGMDYLTRAMYPNLTGIETLDQRNRTGLRIGRPGPAPTGFDVCYGQSPVGRRLAALAVAAFQAQLEAQPESVHAGTPGVVALGALLYSEGPVARELPCERRAFVDSLDGTAAIVRRDGWLAALSGYWRSERIGNPFILDRTQNLSLFHDRFGLVLGGGNDKRKLDAATFEVAEGGYVFYFPPIGGRASAAGRRGRLDLDYGAGRAALRVTIRGPRLVELVAGLETNFSDQVNWLNLQVPVGPGATVRIDGRAVRLDGRKAELRRWPVKRRFEPAAGVCIEVPGGGDFRWPVVPWDSYNIPTHQGSMATATGYLRLSLSGTSLAERTVRVRLGG
ncbi:MAG TPA: hypothetical protein PK280_02410 [Planctomycetota bacterium]|nr:hypothetical protein [Planctomycetota bacterium]